MTLADAAKILVPSSTDRQRRNLEENEAMVGRGERPVHTDIPVSAHYTSADPKFWELGDEIEREERDACDAPAE